MSIFEDKYIQDKLKEFDLKAKYNEDTRNYDIISTYPDFDILTALKHRDSFLN